MALSLSDSLRLYPTHPLSLSHARALAGTERSFCDDRYFKCNLFEHLKERALSRVVTNDKEVVAALRKFAGLLHPPRPFSFLYLAFVFPPRVFVARTLAVKHTPKHLSFVSYAFPAH